MSAIEKAEALREKYPIGTKIVIDYMDDPYPVPSGTKGIIEFVDDIGTCHCKFENGRMLGVIPGIDEFHVID